MVKNHIETPMDFTSNDLLLKGTLTLPKNTKNPSVFLLLPGSGPVDRDENAKGIIRKITSDNFKTLAHYLAEQGYASYRFDKRTTNKAMRASGFNQLLKDAQNAINMIRSLEQVNTKELYVLGHSEGGYLGTLLTSKDPNIKGFIVLASSVTPLDKAVTQQLTYISSLNKDNKRIQQFNQVFTALFSMMRKHKAWEDIDAEILKGEMKKASKTISILPARTVKNMMRKQLQPEWFMESYQHNFEEQAKQIRCPVLLIAGEKDYQVPAADVQYMAETIKNSGNKDVTFTSLPDLNHMLRYNNGAVTPKSQLQSLKEHSLDQRVLDNIGNWLIQH